MKFTLSETAEKEFFFRHKRGTRVMKPSHDIQTPGIGVFIEMAASWVRISIVSIPDMTVIAERTADEEHPPRTIPKALVYLLAEILWVREYGAEESRWIVYSSPELFHQIIDGADRFTKPPPSPAEILAARQRAGLTQSDAASLVSVTPRAWQWWESGRRRMPQASWELFCWKVET